MAKKYGFLDILVDMEKSYNRRVKIANQEMVDDWNKEIKKNEYKISKILANTELIKFDSDSYYDKMYVPFRYEEYVPLAKPNKNKIRKEVGYIKENKLLEYIFKDRKELRIKKCLEYETKLAEYENQYLKDEKNNQKKYKEYLRKEKEKNDKQNELINQKKSKFELKDNEEINNILNIYLNSCTKTQYAKSIKIEYDEGMTELTIEFIEPLKELDNIKEYKYLKTKNEVKEIYYTSRDFEKLYESIIYNTMLSLSCKLKYFLKDKIDDLIINAIVNKVNDINGKIEDFYIASIYINSNELPLNNLNLINSKNFLLSKKMINSTPLIETKNIKKYQFTTNSTIERIDSEINGFDFENLSKILLEKNGFYDVFVTQASCDYGTDVIAYKDGIKYAIQCKKYSNKVGIKAVQEILASKTMYNCHVGVVLTNNYFTPNAIKLAESNNILLWDKNKLEEMIKFSNLDNNRK